MVEPRIRPFASRTRDDALDALLCREVVEVGAAPSAVVAWVRRGPSGWVARVGAAGCDDGAIFDLASVTKPLTALVAARLVADHALRWETTVGELLPELRGLPAARARLGDLLAHRAGVPAWGALYRRDPFPPIEPGTHASLPPDVDVDIPLATMLERAASRLEREPRVEVYSDLGYVLAGAMIARALGAKLEGAWAELGPTSVSSLRASLVDFDARVVPTEDVPWRGGLVRGVVHDENAWAIERAGGDPGHAGAFSTVDAIARVAVGFADALAGVDGGLVSPSMARAMMVAKGAGTHRIGWDTPSVGASSSGTRFGPRSFGHLGFTGASVWGDPDAGAVAVLLTNRVSPSRGNQRIRAARPRVHDALWTT